LSTPKLFFHLLPGSPSFPHYFCRPIRVASIFHCVFLHSRFSSFEYTPDFPRLGCFSRDLVADLFPCTRIAFPWLSRDPTVTMGCIFFLFLQTEHGRLPSNPQAIDGYDSKLAIVFVAVLRRPSLGPPRRFSDCKNFLWPYLLSFFSFHFLRASLPLLSLNTYCNEWYEITPPPPPTPPPPIPLISLSPC